MQEPKLAEALKRAAQAERELEELKKIITQHAPELWKAIRVGYYGESEESDIQQINDVLDAIQYHHKKINNSRKTMVYWWKENFSLEVIAFAGECCIINISRCSIPYINKILEEWKKQNITTVEEAKKYIETIEKSKIEAKKRTATTKKPVVYINLHPDYDYSSVVVNTQGEKIPVLNNYVKLINWFSWINKIEENVFQFRINSGFAEENKKTLHIKRAYVFAQRMQEQGIKVLVRNTKEDVWAVLSTPNFNKQQMYEMEVAVDQPDQNIMHIRENIKKYETLAAFAEEKNPEKAEQIKEFLEGEKLQLKLLETKEQERQEKIKTL